MKKKKKVLSLNQKKRLLKWEIPHLVQALKEEHQVTTIHLMTDLIFTSHKTVGFVFDGKTFFPIFVKENFLGLLVCFHSLSAFKIQRIEHFINSYILQVFLKIVSLSDENSSSILDKSLSSREKLPKMGNHPESDDLKKCKGEAKDPVLDFLDFDLSDEENFYFPLNENQEEIKKSISDVKESVFSFRKRKWKNLSSENTEKKNKTFFPILVEKEKQNRLLKTAYSLYLKSSCFAFLTAEDFEWKDNIFQELNGIFVCIPSFHNLSFFQKDILTQALLQKKLSCPMVLGVEEKKSLPPDCQKLFHTFA